MKNKVMFVLEVVEKITIILFLITMCYGLPDYYTQVKRIEVEMVGK